VKVVYELLNFNNNAIVGELSISNFVAYKSLKISLDIIHQQPYKWEVSKSSRGFSLFTSRTFSEFCARLYNGVDDFVIKWNYKGTEVFKNKLEELPVEGEIELLNSKNHFLLFVGLFIAEMEMQMKALD
jgi:hypothetical protein